MLWELVGEYIARTWGTHGEIDGNTLGTKEKNLPLPLQPQRKKIKAA
jgi:hypothetical protein